MEALPGLALHEFRALVLYYHHRSISALALDAFEAFVADGGGVLAVHSVTASFKESARYFEVLGGRFVGHGPVGSFEIKPVAADDEVFGENPGFAVTDELYLHELQPDVRPHFYAEHEGERVPVVWTHAYGRGRVCYACPGHRAATMRLPQYRQLLVRGLRWVCGAGS